ncbi:MAG: nucleotidyltransferase family protein [Dehalococcoidia bacterium]|nr:nucleotidyltransferase family protein [Dehalococcoidia bacterium]
MSADRRRTAQWLRIASQGDTPRLSRGLVTALDRLDTRQLCEIAVEQRMEPWIVAALDAAGRSAVADSSGLRAAALRRALLGLQLEHELRALLKTFDQCAIPSILLKGPAVAARYYPRPELRPYGDIDLLVRDTDEERAHELLEARGFTLTGGGHDDPLHHDHAKFQSIFERSDGCIVELHRDHLQIGLRPLTLDEVWHRAQPAPGGLAARVLDDHDQFVLLAVHLQRHNFERLVWFKDLDLMVRRVAFDWTRIEAIAATEGCLSSVGYVLSLLADVLGTPLPEGARAIVSRRGLLDRTTQSLLWPRSRVLSLEPHRQWRLRRAVQFAPETGLLRGGLPSLLTWGRRGAKARVLLAAIAHRDHPR